MGVAMVKVAMARVGCHGGVVGMVTPGACMYGKGGRDGDDVGCRNSEVEARQSEEERK